MFYVHVSVSQKFVRSPDTVSVLQLYYEEHEVLADTEMRDRRSDFPKIKEEQLAGGETSVSSYVFSALVETDQA